MHDEGKNSKFNQQRRPDVRGLKNDYIAGAFCARWYIFYKAANSKATGGDINAENRCRRLCHTQRSSQ
jgi:hypothetical protein